jgi:hypothetical protein
MSERVGQAHATPRWGVRSAMVFTWATDMAFSLGAATVTHPASEYKGFTYFFHIDRLPE